MSDAPAAVAATALIAEDEPLLAEALRSELARVWPALSVVATVGDGASAVRAALALKPDVLFFDIRMPGMSGLEAASELADGWDCASSQHPFPALVFVTAYDQYAIEAFETRAIDYLLKPVQPARLRKSMEKVQLALAQRAQSATFFEASLDRIRALVDAAPGLAQTAPAEPLTVIQASVGNRIRMLPIEEVLCFEAADKYLRVLTADAEYLIRTPLKELLPRLGSQAFWQIHRGIVVRACAIDSVLRDEAGRLTLTLRGRADKFSVSRVYAHRFKAM
ncbi:MAG: LytTR family DNA-binding domain-containing protein [Burkholderiales bacterium]